MDVLIKPQLARKQSDPEATLVDTGLDEIWLVHRWGPAKYVGNCGRWQDAPVCLIERLPDATIAKIKQAVASRSGDGGEIELRKIVFPPPISEEF